MPAYLENLSFPENLSYLEALKLSLDITWEDEQTDRKVRGIARRAEAYLRKAAGKDIQFSFDMEDQALLQLLFDCARYIRCNALDEFGVNYASELFALRANAHVEGMEAEADGNEML